MKIFILISALALMQSCCVYHTSTNTPKGKVSEIGIAPYKSRPTEVKR